MLNTRQMINLRVNGFDYEVHIEPWKFLLDVLLAELGYPGVKAGWSNGSPACAFTRPSS